MKSEFQIKVEILNKYNSILGKSNVHTDNILITVDDENSRSDVLKIKFIPSCSVLLTEENVSFIEDDKGVYVNIYEDDKIIDSYKFYYNMFEVEDTGYE